MISPVLAAWADGIRPDPDLTTCEWADAVRVLSSKASAEPGRYRTSRTPYMREPADCISPSSPVRRCTVMKAAQVGYTEVLCNAVGYVIHHAPGPAMVVQPTVDLAKRFSQQRLDPMIEDTPELKARVSKLRPRDAGNTVFSKEFVGGLLRIVGANSATALRSMPVRYLFLDEEDGYPENVDEEGDPIELAIQRTNTFGQRAKIFEGSTPTVAGRSKIERNFLAGDQRYYFVPCPHCGHYQRLVFANLRWDQNRPATAHYVCVENGCAIEERHKTEMLARGEWRPTAIAQRPDHRSYHISALYSPLGWLSWADIARAWLDAQGHEPKRQVFINTVLGETWVERGDAPEWERISERRETWHRGEVPDGVAILTAGCDVQKDRFEVSVWGWGPGCESWLVDHHVIPGGPDHAPAWRALEDIRNGLFGGLPISALAIDLGYETASVYAWARHRANVIPVKGIDGFDRLRPVEGPKHVEGKGGAINIYLVAVSVFKLETYRWLRLPKPTPDDLEAGMGYEPGHIHLPANASDEFLKQLVGEQLVTIRNKRGYAKREWQKLRERQEALDCRNYARAAAYVLGIDRLTADGWNAVRARNPRLVESPVPATAVPPPAPPARPATSWALGDRTFRL